MKFICTRENLSKALGVVIKASTNRGSLPILSHVLLATLEGQLKLSATDLEIALSVRLGGKLEQPGSLTVPARLFADYVLASSDDRLTLEVKETTLKVSSERFKATIKGLPAQEFPIIPEVKGGALVGVPAGPFKEAVESIRFASALDETRPVLTGFLLKTDGKKLICVATDSYRLAEKTIGLNQGEASFSCVVPSRVGLELARLAEPSLDLIELRVSDNQVKAVLGSSELVSRVIDGDFPNYEQIIPQASKTSFVADCDQLISALRAAALFSQDIAHNVRLIIQKDQPILVKSTGGQVGDQEAQVKAKVKVGQEPLTIAFNARYLIDVLAVIETDQVSFELTDSTGAALIRPVGPNDYRALVMPLRLEEGEQN